MGREDKQVHALDGVLRTVEFWTRATSIYLSYKLCQLNTLAMKTAGCSQQRVQEHWDQHHDRAAQRMYHLAVDLRGFYLKVLVVGSCATSRGPAHLLDGAGAQPNYLGPSPRTPRHVAVLPASLRL
jgi:hypothetical protein